MAVVSVKNLELTSRSSHSKAWPRQRKLERFIGSWNHLLDKWSFALSKDDKWLDRNKRSPYFGLEMCWMDQSQGGISVCLFEVVRSKILYNAHCQCPNDRPLQNEPHQQLASIKPPPSFVSFSQGRLLRTTPQTRSSIHARKCRWRVFICQLTVKAINVGFE